MNESLHLTMTELEAGLAHILDTPKDKGVLEMIVRRPVVDAREVLDSGRLDLEEGLVGDNWKTRGSTANADGSADPDKQLNIMNARVIGLLAGDRERWALAGDQLFLDMDLSRENLPPGTRLALGEAVVEITAKPHTGCKKFAARFGVDALKIISTKQGNELQMRGICARVVQPGEIRVGDVARKITALR
jgi:hypothetical protein